MDDAEFDRLAENVFREQLKLERSIRSYTDNNPYCSQCPPEDNCCISEVSDRGLKMLTLWERYVIDRTFLEHKDIDKEHDEDDPRCSYLSDRGCIIPEGKPANCIRYFCRSTRKKMINYKLGTVLTSLNRISLDMSELMQDKFSPKKEKRVISDIDKSLKKASKILKKHKKIKEKYHYQSITSSFAIC